MKRAFLAALLAVSFMVGGCSKASKEDCQKAADNLAAKGGVNGQLKAGSMMKEGGDVRCEGRYTPAKAKCLAELEEVTEKTMKTCD